MEASTMVSALSVTALANKVIQAQVPTTSKCLGRGIEILSDTEGLIDRYADLLDNTVRATFQSSINGMQARRQALQNANILQSVSPKRLLKAYKFEKDVCDIRDNVRRVLDKARQVEMDNLLPKAETVRNFPNAPPAVPASPVASDLIANPEDPGGDVEVGPIRWGQDIDGEVRGLLNLLPHYVGNTNISTRKTPQDGVVVVHFLFAVDAIAFDINWNAAVPKGFESVSVQLLDD